MFKKLPERKLNRLKNFDYSKNGFYFVTICVKYHVKFFGHVENNEMVLNRFGKIVNKQWLWMAEQYPWIKLDEFIIMPNHVHGIIKIDKTKSVESVVRGRDNHVWHGRDNPRVVPTDFINKKLYNRQKNLLSKSICAFKTTSSKMIRQIDRHDFSWQRSFYDKIIHDEHALKTIRKYIKNNPAKWPKDRNNQWRWM